MAVGDPGRLAAGRAIRRTLACAAVFSVVTGPVKETPVLYDHAPWLNDPYDTVVSFAMFFVPLLTVGCAGRVLLCRRKEPVPATRIGDLLRGGRVLLAAVAVTSVSEWISLAAGANRAQWNGATWVQVDMLAAISVLAIHAGRAQVRAASPRKRESATGAGTVDWLTDVLALAERGSTQLGPFGIHVLRTVRWADRNLVSVARRHPVRGAAVIAALFGLVIGGAQSVSEGCFALDALTAVLLLGGGMYALLMAAGNYLGVVRSGQRLAGARRRAADASVLACAGTLVVFAFRNSLWWIVGSNGGAAGIPQLWLLLTIFAIPFFVLPFAVETLARRHDTP